LPTKRFFMMILPRTQHNRCFGLRPAQIQAEAAFLPRKEQGTRTAGMPHTLKEARKDCKNSKSGRLILT
jgi:hypothetical protein